MLLTVLTLLMVGQTEPIEVTEEVSSPTNDELLQRIELLEQRLEQADDSSRRRGATITVAGHVDVGFFVPQGNAGSGVLLDVNNQAFPEYKDRFAWVFLGDLYSPAVNSRGEPADLGELPGVNRFDSIHSRGAPGFLVNEAHLRVNAGLTSSFLAQVGVNFVPRSGAEFDWGDFMHVDIAQLEWLPFESGKTSVFVGKFDSLFGIEYRDRRAPQRFGITPSLVSRYTTGTPIGLKVRSKFLPDDLLVVAASVTNGSSIVEPFHFTSEIDLNWAKTLSGRVSLNPHLGDFEVEVGFSGSVGAADLSRRSLDMMWFIGVDAIVNWSNRVVLKMQWIRGFAPGSASENVYGLSLHHGGYAELNALVVPWFGILARGEFRDAFVFLGSERAYLTKSWRATAGLRAVVNPFVTIKAEYLFNGEFRGIPSIDNNVFTASLVVAF